MKLIFFFLVLVTLPAQGRVIVISDIDDSLKINSGFTLKGLIEFTKGEIRPFQDMQVLFREFEAKNAQILYLSSSYKHLYDGELWINENGFPAGTVIQRDESSYLDGKLFKLQKLNEIFSSSQINPDDTFFFIGDNYGDDDAVYADIIRKFKLEKISTVLIRDIKMNQIFPAMEVKDRPYEGMTYFVSGRELARIFFVKFFTKEISFDALILLNRTYYARKGILEFQRRNLKERIISRSCVLYDFKCEAYANKRTEEILKSYHNP